VDGSEESISKSRYLNQELLEGCKITGILSLFVNDVEFIGSKSVKFPEKVFIESGSLLLLNIMLEFDVQVKTVEISSVLFEPLVFNFLSRFKRSELFPSDPRGMNV